MTFTTQGTTQPQVIDLLLTGIRAAVADQSIAVTDGFPGPGEPTVIVSVGGTSDATTDGQKTWAYLGAHRMWEKYKVGITVSVVYGGDGQQAEVAGADAQKAARDMAFLVVHAIENFLVADPTLGQFFNTGNVLGGWITLVDVKLQQTDDQTAAIGAIAEVAMHCEVNALI